MTERGRDNWDLDRHVRQRYKGKSGGQRGKLEMRNEKTATEVIREYKRGR